MSVLSQTQTPSESLLTVRTQTLQTNLREMTSKRGCLSYQADFRRYDDVGGRVVILCEPGSKVPVRCLERATELFKAMQADLEVQQKRYGYKRIGYDPTIASAARLYLIAKAKRGAHAAGTLDSEANALDRFIRRSKNARLSSITGPWIDAYIERRQKERGCRKGSLCSPSTIRNEVMALSGMYTYAMKLKLVRHNPVTDATLVPPVQLGKVEITWLRGTEAGRLLDAAAKLDAETRAAREAVDAYMAAKKRGEKPGAPSAATFAAARRYAWCEAVISTFLYTGGRLEEVLGLEVEDINFETRRVHFQDNDHRTLKKKHHRRKPKLWRPLADTLRHYLDETGLVAGLLFPSATGEMMHAFTKQLARCVARAGLLEPGRHISHHVMRHTHATRLLCTLIKAEGGIWAERSVDNVRRALGHRTAKLIEMVYGHETDGERRRKCLSFEHGRELPAKRLRKIEAIA